MVTAIELLKELQRMLRHVLGDTFWPVFLGLFALWLIRPGGTNLQAGLRRRYLAIFVVANLAQLHVAVRAAGWPYGWRSGLSHLVDWPRWLPLLAIAMYASTRVFGAGGAYRRTMLLLPHAAGHCPACGYPGIHERCPECGATRAPAKPPWSWRPIGAALLLCGLAVLGPELVRLALVAWDSSPHFLSLFAWILLLLLLVLGIVWAIREIRRSATLEGGEGPPGN